MEGKKGTGKDRDRKPLGQVLMSFAPKTYLSKQWAAVNTHSGAIKVPPQKCIPNLGENRVEILVNSDDSFYRKPERSIHSILTMSMLSQITERQGYQPISRTAGTACCLPIRNFPEGPLHITP